MYKIYPDLPAPDTSIYHLERACRDLLHVDHLLNVNEEARMLSVLRAQPPSILTQQQFTKNEWALLMTLLSSYPHYAPHELLLSNITSLSVDACRKRLQEVQLLGPGEVKRELKPVYRALAGIRGKLTKLYPGLKVFFIRDTGYIIATEN